MAGDRRERKLKALKEAEAEYHAHLKRCNDCLDKLCMVGKVRYQIKEKLQQALYGIRKEAYLP